VQPIPATDGERRHGVFAQILVDFDAAILQENFQALPLVKGIVAGRLLPVCSREEHGGDLLDFDFELLEEGKASHSALQQNRYAHQMDSFFACQMN
jgi:hypothetical protein